MRVLGLTLVASLLAPAVSSGSLEEALRSRWQNAWVLLRTEASSDCDASYTNNPVSGGRVQLGGHHGFSAGELARVHGVQVRRARVDLLLDVAEPLRISYHEGPFELYGQPGCKLELEFAVKRRLIRQRAASEIEALLAEVLERHQSREAAEASPSYNGRVVEPLPEDYDQTLAAYREWKAEELRRHLHLRLAEALNEARRLAERVREDTAYEAGFTHGLRAYRDGQDWTDCEALANRRFSPAWGRSPTELSDSEEKQWKEGFRDGQQLTFYLYLAERLEICLR